MKLSDIMPKEISGKDRERYRRIGGNWNYCSNFLAQGATREEIGALLKMEIEANRRDFMFARLLGRLTTFYREDIKAELDSLLSGKK